MKSFLLFVYGTLLKGERNHHFLHDSICVENNCWVYGYLYDTGLGYPVLELDPTHTSKVKGELYSVDAKHLPEIDELEGYQQQGTSNLYERVLEKVYTNQGQEQEALVYTNVAFPIPEEKRIQSGDWREFRMSTERFPVLLQETWDRAISQQDRLLFTKVNKENPPVCGELRFLPVRTGFNHEGKCFATVLIQNGTENHIDFARALLTYQVESEAGKESLTQLFCVPELRVQARSSTPWTFLFEDTKRLRERVEEGSISLSNWYVSSEEMEKDV